MQTEIAIEELVGKTRRTMFWRLYTLPWILLTLVLICGIFWTYHNANPAAPKTAIISTNILEIVEKQKVEIERVRGAAMTNGWGMWLTEPNGSNQFVLTTTKAVYTNEVRLDAKVFAGSLLEMKETTLAQADAVRRLSGVGESLNVASSSLKNGIKGIEKMTSVYTNLPKVAQEGARVVREEKAEDPIPFGVEDWKLAQRLKYDLEGEMTKAIGGLIEFEVERWDGEDKTALKAKLRNGSDLMIKRSFDGFKTYNGIRK